MVILRLNIEEAKALQEALAFDFSDMEPAERVHVSDVENQLDAKLQEYSYELAQANADHRVETEQDR